MENNSILPAVHQNISEHIHTLDNGDNLHLVPPGHELVNVDKRFRELKSARLQFDSLQSLTDYVQKFSYGTEICFVSKGDVQVILDYHTREDIGERVHCATYSATRNPVWESVKVLIGSRLSQRDFVNHWTDFKDIVNQPQQADFINQLQKIKVLKKVDEDFQVSHGSKSTKSDASVKYEGVPESFTVLVKPYIELKDAIETTCRISIHDDSSLQLSYKMPRLEEVLQKAEGFFYDIVIQAFADAGIDCPVLQGSVR